MIEKIPDVYNIGNNGKAVITLNINFNEFKRIEAQFDRINVPTSFNKKVSFMDYLEDYYSDKYNLRIEDFLLRIEDFLRMIIKLKNGKIVNENLNEEEHKKIDADNIQTDPDLETPENKKKLDSRLNQNTDSMIKPEKQRFKAGDRVEIPELETSAEVLNVNTASNIIQVKLTNGRTVEYPADTDKIRSLKESLGIGGGVAITIIVAKILSNAFHSIKGRELQAALNKATPQEINTLKSCKIRSRSKRRNATSFRKN